jgi:hypothetical protein
MATGVTTSIDSGNFALTLITKLQLMLSFSSQEVATYLVTCLLVWGVTDEPILEEAVPCPEITGISLFGVAISGTGIYYPDWVEHSGTCLQDGKAPNYMKMNSGTWLSNSLEECCDQYYSGWNKNRCINRKGSGLWYASYADAICVTDCEEGKGSTCGGLANQISDNLFTSPRSCCESKLPWVFIEFCVVSSLLIDYLSKHTLFIVTVFSN